MVKSKKMEAVYLRDAPRWTRELQDNISKFFPLYRTGDLGKYTEDGEFHFVGRKDNQAKMRCQRVELEELRWPPLLLPETGLSLTAFIAVGADKLNAFASPISNGRPKLARLVPAYTVPSLYVPLRSSLLTPNGKTDRKGPQQLVSVFTRADWRRFQAPGQEYQPPSSSVEKQLAHLWISLLRVTEVGLQDDFFGLGESLCAMPLVVAAGREGLSLLTDKIVMNPALIAMAEVASSISKVDLVYHRSYCPASELKYNRFIERVVQMDHHAATAFWKSYLADVDTKPFGDVPKGLSGFCRQMPPTPCQVGKLLAEYQANIYASEYLFRHDQ
ncbi:hypothetical protein ALT_7538 [Aspergillus lentulus]|uniref:Uncharacterized protein n=1 Tax=Aspergillus lentulus TaxID=293939 RepID=A0AAN4TDF4_ASPLE|nr:hypothetical protein ALT_7538 [Aspergillus lentulus]